MNGMNENINGLIIESEETIVPASIDTKKVTLDDLDQFCRLCGTVGDQLMAIFVNEGAEHKLLDKIREHLPMIEVAENDSLPSNVCYACASTLISWHELYHSCKDADTQLRNMIDSLKSNCTENITENDDDENFYPNDVPSNDDRCTGRETNSEERPTLANKIECSLSSSNKLTENGRKLTNQEWRSSETRIAEASVESHIDCYKCKRTFDCDAKWRAHYNEQRIICANLNVFHTYYNQLKSQPLLPPDRINPAFEFACGQCEQRFAVKENLRMHIICFHPCVAKFRCDYCPAKFVTECDLADHRIEHSKGKNAICSKCGGRIKIANLSYETNQQQLMFEWCVCKKTMVNSADTIETRKKLITKQAGSDDGDGKLVRAKIDLNTECSSCSKRFKTPRLLRRHLSAHNNKEECDICGKSYPKLYMKSHKLIHSSQKTFVCDTCGKKFAQCSSLRSHQLLEKNIKKYVCNVCGLQFVLNSRLHTHMKSHAETLPFKCQDCGRQYGYIWQLRQHRIRHSTERAFVCEMCTRSFKTKRHLKQHFVVHYKGK